MALDTVGTDGRRSRGATLDATSGDSGHCHARSLADSRRRRRAGSNGAHRGRPAAPCVASNSLSASWRPCSDDNALSVRRVWGAALRCDRWSPGTTPSAVLERRPSQKTPRWWRSAAAVSLPPPALGARDLRGTSRGDLGADAGTRVAHLSRARSAPANALRESRPGSLLLMEGHLPPAASHCAVLGALATRYEPWSAVSLSATGPPGRAASSSSRWKSFGGHLHR